MAVAVSSPVKRVVKSRYPVASAGATLTSAAAAMTSALAATFAFKSLCINARTSLVK